MKKIKKFLLFLFFVVVIFGIGYAVYRYYFNSQSEPSEINGVSTSAIKQMYYYCANEKLDTTSDWGGTRLPCNKFVTVEFADVSMCKYIEDQDSQEYCYDYFAKKTNNIALCKSWACPRNFPETNNNPSICYESDRVCIAVAKSDPSLCDKMDNYNEDKAYCYDGLARKFNDFSYCKKASGLSDYSNYLSQKCIKDLSVRNNDAESCNQISDSEQKDKCYVEIAIKLNDKSLCEKVSQGKESCLSDVGLNEKNPLACDILNHPDDKYGNGSYWECNKKLSIALQDPSYCEKIDEEVNKDYCYINVSTQLKNPDICEKITYFEDGRERCYTKNAFFLKDPSTCGRNENPDSKDNCYYALAYLYDNTSICLNIRDITKKINCASKKELPVNLMQTLYSFDGYSYDAW